MLLDDHSSKRGNIGIPQNQNFNSTNKIIPNDHSTNKIIPNDHSEYIATKRNSSPRVKAGKDIVRNKLIVISYRD